MSEKTRPTPTDTAPPSKENNKPSTKLPGDTGTPDTVPKTTSGPKKK